VKFEKKQSEIIWSPSPQKIQASNMYKFLTKVAQDYNIESNWTELHKWSVKQTKEFWEALEKFVRIKWISKKNHIYSPPSYAKLFGAQWFNNSLLNFCDNLLPPISETPVLTCCYENGEKTAITAKELHLKVSTLSSWLRLHGLKKGDIVTGILQNSIDTIIYMLATSACGGVWSSCSPDFGTKGITERLGQLNPKIIFADTKYSYKGKYYDCSTTISECHKQLNSLESFILSDKNHSNLQIKDIYYKDDIFASPSNTQIIFEPMRFNDPLYILFSSGTTGKPKCIVHSVGGTLLQHKKELILHSNISPQDNLLFYSTTGWMMWNWMVSALSTRAHLTLYEGCPTFPQTDSLWRVCEQQQVSILGISPGYIEACKKENISFARNSFSHLKTVLSTGSPLPPHHYNWVYNNIKKDLQLSSISGGSDIISCFALGNPLLPVKVGEIQSLGLGMSVEAHDKKGEKLPIDKKGELICNKPFVSMPIYFMNDPNNLKYKSSYSAVSCYGAEVWKHGDFIEHKISGGIVIHGRSDSTLNPGGIRIGTAEIYNSISKLSFIKDSVVVAKKDKKGCESIALFVVTTDSLRINRSHLEQIQRQISSDLTKRHVPKYIKQVSQIPYTSNGKKMEILVTKILNEPKSTDLSSHLDQNLIKEYRTQID
jgi:acetoacetyl-CoA synthetase